MNANEYQKLAMRTDDGRSTERILNKIGTSGETKVGDANINIGLLLEASLGLSGETGETLDIIKKWIFHEKEIDIAHLRKEVGDICWYIAAMCKAIDIDLETVMQMNVDKLLARYPDGFNTNRANNREENDI